MGKILADVYNIGVHTLNPKPFSGTYPNPKPSNNKGLCFCMGAMCTLTEDVSKIGFRVLGPSNSRSWTVMLEKQEMLLKNLEHRNEP